MYNYYFCICICKKREREGEEEERVSRIPSSIYILHTNIKGQKIPRKYITDKQKYTYTTNTHYRTPPRTKVFCKCIKILCYLVKIKIVISVKFVGIERKNEEEQKNNNNKEIIYPHE